MEVNLGHELAISRARRADELDAIGCSSIALRVKRHGRVSARRLFLADVSHCLSFWKACFWAIGELGRRRRWTGGKGAAFRGESKRGSATYLLQNPVHVSEPVRRWLHGVHESHSFLLIAHSFSSLVISHHPVDTWIRSISRSRGRGLQWNLCRVQPKLLPPHASIGIGHAVPAKHGLVVSLTLTLCGTRGEEKFDLGNSTELAVEEVDRCRSLKGFSFFFFVLESAWRLIRMLSRVCYYVVLLLIFEAKKTRSLPCHEAKSVVVSGGRHQNLRQGRIDATTEVPSWASSWGMAALLSPLLLQFNAKMFDNGQAESRP